jgi:hypothetical protein
VKDIREFQQKGELVFLTVDSGNLSIKAKTRLD